METFNVIEFHRTRDFSRKMNATFEFIRQNYKALGKSLVVIAGPPVLIASMILGSFFSNLTNLTSATASGNADVLNYFGSVSFWIQMVVMFIFLLVSSVMTIATVNNYILLYGEKQSNRIEVREVWERVSVTFWMYLSSMFLFTFMFIAVYAVLAIPVVLLVAISPAFVVFAVFVFVCVVFYLAFSFSLTFIVRNYEKKEFFEAIVRSFRLVQGKWWSTFGLIMVLYFIFSTISYVFVIPAYVSIFVSTLHDTSTEATTQSSSAGYLSAVFFAVYYMVQLLLTSLPNIGIAFQYFNLVELKEAKGLLNKIDTLGQPREPLSSPEEQY